MDEQLFERFREAISTIDQRERMHFIVRLLRDMSEEDAGNVIASYRDGVFLLCAFGPCAASFHRLVMDRIDSLRLQGEIDRELRLDAKGRKGDGDAPLRS